MSAVGYEGHIWEELFGQFSFGKYGKYIILLIVLLVVVVIYLIAKKIF